METKTNKGEKKIRAMAEIEISKSLLVIFFIKVTKNFTSNCV